MARLSKEQKNLLVAIQDAMRVEGTTTPYLFIERDHAKTLTAMKPALIGVNNDLPDPEGKNRVAAVLSAEGHTEADKVRNAPKRAAPTPAPAPAGEVEIESGVPVPETRRGRAAAENPWPIDKLGVNQSFFIPVSPEVAEPWKKYASLASAANKRFNKEGSADRRRFVIRESEKNGQKGARIWRIENEKPNTSAADSTAAAAAAQPPAGTAGFGAPAPTA